jgi:hypothetical protein
MSGGMTDQTQSQDLGLQIVEVYAFPYSLDSPMYMSHAILSADEAYFMYIISLIIT